MKRSIVAGLAVSLALAACSQSGSPNQADAASGPMRPSRSGNVVRFDPASLQLERIRVAPVTDAALPIDEFEVPGKVEAIPRSVARLAVPVPGRVRDVTVTLGDRVRAGQVVLTLETPDVSELQSAWRQARADVKQREAAVAKAEADVSRVRDLLANRAIAQKDVLVAETELAVAMAALEQARATHDDVSRRLRLFGVNADQAEALASVRSPINGEVVEIAVAPGEYRSDTTSTAVTVADLTRVWIVASVPESALARIQTGQPVTIDLAAYPDERFEGRVTRVAGLSTPTHAACGSSWRWTTSAGC